MVHVAIGENMSVALEMSCGLISIPSHVPEDLVDTISLDWCPEFLEAAWFSEERMLQKISEVPEGS